MQDPKTRIWKYVAARTLPTSSEEIFSGLLGESGLTFESQESTFWDYKAAFPFSLTDDYGGGIIRLICAFYNSFGGVIIFGVHDEKRTAGHNRVNINIERLNTFLREKLTAPIECIYSKYVLTSNKEEAITVDVILVPQRPANLAPVSFAVNIGRYKAGRVYWRSNHEVLDATSTELPFLYGARTFSTDQSVERNNRIIRALPPNPATIKEFVGRLKALNSLWEWLSDEHEPRTFLYGKGGSGKSTIAFELARLASDVPEAFKDREGRGFDAAIFLSAKKKSLVTATGRIQDNVDYDFTTPRELFEKILLLSEWTDTPERLRDSEILNELENLLNNFRILIVIDDIDTLTTNNVDPGMDTLYRLLVRAKVGSKVLYTLRNAPSQSLANSIEVPGLDIDSEYPEFIEKCCKQFGMPIPQIAIMSGDLAVVSERRPLILETIICLRRTCGSYEEALRIFRSRGGDETRAYLFDREYNTLGADNRARYLLAALSLFGKPVSFTDLEVVLRFDSQQVKDAIGEVTEMFLSTSINEKTGETLFSLGQSTSEYIKSQRQNLDLFPALKETVASFRRNIHPKKKEIDLLKLKIDRYFRENDLEAALHLLRSQDDPSITQHPEYQMMFGYVCAKQIPPQVDIAREAFRYAARMSYADIEAMRVWFFMERTSGRGLNSAIEVCDHVLNGKGYKGIAISEFLLKKGFALLELAKNEFYGDQERAIEYFKEATHLHLQGVHRQIADLGPAPGKAFAWCSTCFATFRDHAIQVGLDRELIEFICSLTDVYLDAAAQPMSQFIYWFGRPGERRVAMRNKGLLSKLEGHLNSKRKAQFYDENIRTSLLRVCSESMSRLDVATDPR